MTAPRLIRRGAAGSQEWPQPETPVEPEDEAPRPTSRRISFELPDGFMATISLVPYTEQAADAEDAVEPLPPADPALIDTTS